MANQQSDNKKVNPVDIQKYLEGIDYPATADDIAQHAEDNDAPEEVLMVLRQLPAKEYKNAADVSKEAGRIK